VNLHHPRLSRFLRRTFLSGALGLSINAIGNLAIAPTVISPAGNVSLVAGTETTIVATAATLVGIPGMNYIPIVVGEFVGLEGGAASTALVIAARYAGGADFDTQTIDTGLQVINATISAAIVLVGANVRAAANGNIGSGAVQVTGLATTNAVTARGTSCKFAVLLLPGPDL
jgi:hypothetical protein